jgi:hypothetical protein
MYSLKTFCKIHNIFSCLVKKNSKIKQHDHTNLINNVHLWYIYAMWTLIISIPTFIFRYSNWQQNFSIRDASHNPILRIHGPCCVFGMACCEDNDITEVMFTDNKHPNIYGSLEQELPTRPKHLSSPEFLVRFVLLDL